MRFLPRTYSRLLAQIMRILIPGVRFVNALLMGIVFMSSVLVTACGTVAVDRVSAPISASDTDYFRLRFTDRAINLSVAAPTNTMQLTAVPLNAAGEPLTGVTESVVFESASPEITISPSGLLTARAVATEILIIGRLQIGTVTRVDTTMVNITATAPAHIPTSLLVDPIAPDSNKWSANIFSGNKPLFPREANGTPIRGLFIAYESSSLGVAKAYSGTTFDPESGSFVDVGFLQALGSGHTTVRASVYAYGTRLAASTDYVIGPPTFLLMNLYEQPSPTGIGTVITFGLPSLKLGVGGRIAFNTTFLTHPTGIVIESVDGSPAPFCTGDLSALPPKLPFASMCLFPGGAGTYIYRAVEGGASGPLVVTAEAP